MKGQSIDFCLVLCGLLAFGCAPSLEKQWEWDNEPLSSDSGISDDDNGIYSRVVNTTDYEEWVYLDLETNDIVPVSDSMNSMDWDLGMLRYHVKLNSGLHGPAEVQATIIEGEVYEDYTAIPSDGYQIDLQDDDNTDANENSNNEETPPKPPEV